MQFDTASTTAPTTPIIIPESKHDAPKLTDWRDDTVRMAIVSGVVLTIGIVVLAVLAVRLSLALPTILDMILGVIIFSAIPWILLSISFIRVVWMRASLSRWRVEAEVTRLAAEMQLSQIDTNQDGKVSHGELKQFLDYLRYLYHDGSPTAATAASHGILTRQWQQYRDLLIQSGLAETVTRRGGEGFRLTDSVKGMSWEKLERLVMSSWKGG